MSARPTSRLHRWLRRIGIGLAAALAVAIVIGSFYEMLTRRHIASVFPAPGKRVDIGGRRIHIDCRGTGTPVVVFEAGLDTYGSVSWSAVQGPVARFTRACSYDRAGLMWSDRSPQARDAVAIATDLHKALAAAGETGPFVLVGHSLGGPYVMTFTRLFGKDVSGVVLVDASHPDQQARIKAATGQQVTPSLAMPNLLAALEWTGLPRLIMPPERHDKLSPRSNAMMAAYRPQSLGPMLDERSQLDASMREAGELRTLGDRPTVVLTGVAPYRDAQIATMKLSKAQGRQLQTAWLAMQDEEAGWSSCSRHQRLDDSHPTTSSSSGPTP